MTSLNSTEILMEKFQAEIKRLHCDCDNVGSVDCIVVNPNTYDFDGYEIPEEQKAAQSLIVISDDRCGTIDLNAGKTLENLAKLPDGAGTIAFWDAVVDNVD
jgi:hypothetical protein